MSPLSDLRRNAFAVIGALGLLACAPDSVVDAGSTGDANLDRGPAETTMVSGTFGSTSTGGMATTVDPSTSGVIPWDTGWTTGAADTSSDDEGVDPGVIPAACRRIPGGAPEACRGAPAWSHVLVKDEATLETLAGHPCIAADITIEPPSQQVLSLEALARLRHLCGDLRLAGWERAGFVDVDALRQLESVDGRLTIQGHWGADDLSALGSLRHVRGLEFGPSSISSLAGLPAFESLPDGLTIALSTLEHGREFPVLRTVGHLSLWGASSRVEFPALQAIEGNLTIASGSPHVVDLPELTQVGGDLMVHRRGRVELSAPKLTRIAGDFRVEDTQNTRIGPLSQLEIIAGKLRITDNPQLVQLVGFESLRQLGSVLVARNVQLADEHVRGVLGFANVAGPDKVTQNLDSEGISDPCPWELDGECDSQIPDATGLCGLETDQVDCNTVDCSGIGESCFGRPCCGSGECTPGYVCQ